jgi:hypothetical protein
MPESACFRAFRIAALDAGLDDAAYLVGGAGPGGYGDIISPPSERTLTPGDVLILDLGGVHDGYYCDFDRNFAVGAVPDAARRALEGVWRATEAGLAAARPGATCADLFRAMLGVMSGAGASDASVGRLGHGLGMQLTEFPSIAPWDRTVLEPGMVLTLEPGMAFGDGAVMVHEENIVIREDGAELLTVRAPRDMRSSADGVQNTAEQDRQAARRRFSAPCGRLRKTRPEPVMPRSGREWKATSWRSIPPMPAASTGAIRAGWRASGRIGYQTITTPSGHWRKVDSAVAAARAYSSLTS